MTVPPADLLAAQDPDEPFDVYRADGRLTGQVKARAAVHRDGDWHRAVHVWVVGRDTDGDPFVLMQRRSALKDTWPGVLDVTVGGHYRAGETLVETLREAEEEIGVTVTLEGLVPLGVRVMANEEPEIGLYDRELQDVFLLLDDRSLTAYRPHPAELAEMIRIPLADLVALQRGEADAIAVRSIAPGGGTERDGTVTLADFVPTIDRYVLRVAAAIEQVLRGETGVVI